MNEIQTPGVPTREGYDQPTPMQALAAREEGPLATEQWKPSRQECLRNYEVKIRFLSIGCVISVGCKEIPFTSVKLAMECLNDYVERPYETGQIWEKRFLEEEE